MHPYKRLVEWLYTEKITVLPITLAQGDIISGIYASRVKGKYYSMEDQTVATYLYLCIIGQSY